MAYNNSITEFTGKFANGGQRSHLFQVEGLFPTRAAGEAQEKIPFLVKAAQLPASTLGIIEVPWRGRKIKIPGDRTFAEWQITVLADTEGKLRNSFEKWSHIFNSHEGNSSLDELHTPFEVESMNDWQIKQLNRNGQPMKKYNFVGVWPSEVSSVDMSMENVDALTEFTVTLQYSYWTSDTTDSNQND